MSDKKELIKNLELLKKNNLITEEEFKEKLSKINLSKEEDIIVSNDESEAISVDPNSLKNPILEVKNFTKQYKGRSKPAVNNINFNIYPGHFHVFIGANGAGKTTTMKSIIGAYGKFSGEIKIFGHPNGTVLANKRLGYIPEKAIFPKKISAINYLISMAMLSGIKKSVASKNAIETLKQLNLYELRNKKPSSFSSGQKKKILLAQALVHDPDILILDEPAANLDPLARDTLFNTLLELQKKGKSIFISSHILDEVGRYATYVTILDGGKIVYDSPVDKNTSLRKIYLKYVKEGSVDEQKEASNVKN